MQAGTCRAIRREELKLGDHICTPRRSGLYYHHGIYVGDDMVIHLSGPRTTTGFGFASFKSSSFADTSRCTNFGFQKGLRGGTIQTCLNCFLDGGSLFIYDYESVGISVKPPNEVVETAKRMLRESEFSDDYNVATRNCEHFATFCKTGLHFSMQTQKAATTFCTLM